MSWLTEVIRPKIRNLFARRDVPENLWSQCAGCQRMIFTKDFVANMRVCADCGHHTRGTAIERLTWTFDKDSFTRIELPKAVVDPLKFATRNATPIA
jgi:acetyl-CoA carboxylase carboxyl transferase subunit beta